MKNNIFKKCVLDFEMGMVIWFMLFCSSNDIVCFIQGVTYSQTWIEWQNLYKENNKYVKYVKRQKMKIYRYG